MDNENIYDVAYGNADTENPINENSHDKNSNKKNMKRKKGIGNFIISGIIFSILGGIVGTVSTYYVLQESNINNKMYTAPNPPVFDTDESALTATQVYEKVAPAVVVVSVKSITSYNGFFSQETEGIGSGFIINEEGYILTNYHVIEGANEVTVTLSDKREVKATVVNYDQEQDVAMIKIVDDIEVPGVVELGDSDALLTGEQVLAIGTPLSRDLSFTLTDGIVSAMNRNVETDSGVALNLIQTNAAINPGNSGGPLINTKGEVVGINTMKMGGEVEGLGFAIPINDVKGKIESLSKPILLLGVSVRTITEELSEQLDMEQGLYIVEVTPFSPAEIGGLKPQDIITKVDGKRVKVFEELQEIKNEKDEGETMEIEYIRDGKTQKATLTLKAN